MPTVDILVEAQMGPGIVKSPAVLLPAGLTLVDIQIVSSSWPDPGLFWSVDVERSLNAGLTWRYWFGLGGGTGDQFYNELNQPVVPTVGVILAKPGPQSYFRATLSLNKKTHIGLRGIAK